MNKKTQKAKKIREIWAQSDALRMGMGWTEDDIEKPLIMVNDVFGESHPGSIHLDKLTKEINTGIIENGGKPVDFHITDICDGIAQGHNGMNYILLSREIIADMVEIHGNVHPWDGMVLVSSCDKSIPAHLIAAARLDIPTVFVPGGTMRPGPYMTTSGKGGEVTLQNKQNKINDFEVMQYKKTGCPSCGACQFLGTANTMQALSEALGLSLPTTALSSATMIDIQQTSRMAGKAVMRLKEKNIKVSDILTKEAFENAIIIHAAIGGSTNAMIHLPALAHALGWELDVKKFDEINKKIPHLCNVAPSGRYPAETLWFAGGIPAVQEELREYLSLDVITVTGNTLGENLDAVKSSGFYERNIGYLANYGLKKSDIITPINESNEKGSVAVLEGNIAPDGAVIKYSAVSEDMMYHVGKAKVFNCEEDCNQAVVDRNVDPGDVLVIRYEGPRGSGMPEMYMTTEAIMSDPRINSSTVLITDGRYSGATRGPCVGHISPEGVTGGPIAFIEDEDLIELDINNRTINIVGIKGEKVDKYEVESIMKERKKKWTPPNLSNRKGIFKKYTESATSGMKGAYMK
ncbi:dihydroxy-acid dehydratase [Anaerococcus sp. AGMB00486]|uniref:Dihydroxy-acid dehydratase n=1 Tax=Anaerococcus faecalis TaxID=2742993 RepID=A0ABX2NCI8_9FIRM|nr:dihydroxy-acid dehydratase [Anaerococcus faecalis]NVF12408.1 dihydroxy-acid dehydratase [Anaerococcus faecalis]